MMTNEQIAKLILLSIVWGGAYLFSGMVVDYIHPLWAVAIRVSLAALVMLVVLKVVGLHLPQTLREWRPFLVMGLLNNVIPFGAIFYSQVYISVSLASIINAMTPVFTFAVMAAFGAEALTPSRILGGLTGIAGTVLLFGGDLSFASHGSIGIVLALAGAASYAFAGLWGKLNLTGIAPVKSATCQLLSSSGIMVLVLIVTGIALPTSMPPTSIILALVGLAVVGTAFAYVLFFDILSKSGASNAMLVTLLIPISGSCLGWLVMDDQLTSYQLAGAAVIATALLIIDGRLFKRLVA
ncbi:MAG TPA: EamA family transporter [Oceanospirillaceae bacterium]|nr:EamA family transporter [Oceanospirillaceae bacterium]